MLGAAGCIAPELLTSVGIAEPGLMPNWLEAGKREYYADPVTLFLIQAILMNFVEVLRWQDMKNPGSVNADPIFKKADGTPFALPATSQTGYPGSQFFDPLGYSKDPAALAVNKVKEIKNGRLAMVAMAGFFVQVAVTGDGPIANLSAHLADPGHVTFFSN